jgi:ATP dependent DNA ligase domain
MPTVLRFIEPCLPSPANRPPSGSGWLHEIKHDGYRLMARRDPVGIRLITRRGNDWSEQFPLVVEAVNHLKVRSCLIDGEVVCCDEHGLDASTSCDAAATRRSPSSMPSTCSGRHGPAARTDRGTQGDAGEYPAGDPPRGPPERAPGARLWADCVPTRLHAGLRGYRVEAAGFALLIRSHQRLAQAQEPAPAGDTPRGGGGLGTIREALMSKVTALISDERPVIRIYGDDTDDHVEIQFETQSDANVAVERLNELFKAATGEVFRLGMRGT